MINKNYKSQLHVDVSDHGHMTTMGNVSKGFAGTPHLNTAAREARECTRLALGNGFFEYLLKKRLGYVVGQGLSYVVHEHDENLAQHQRDFWNILSKTERYPYDNMGQLFPDLYRDYLIDGEVSTIFFCSLSVSCFLGSVTMLKAVSVF